MENILNKVKGQQCQTNITQVNQWYSHDIL